MIPREVVWAVLTLFPVSELAIGARKRAAARDASVQDRGTLRLLIAIIAVSITLAFGATLVPQAKMNVPRQVADLLAVVLTLSGLLLRWFSILTLGRYFTVNLAVHPGHQVVRHGPYRHIRHPSYTGLLLAFLGLGMYLANWLSLVLLMLPITAALIHRIREEEEVLTQSLGQEYVVYCSQTKKLIPWIY